MLDQLLPLFKTKTFLQVTITILGTVITSGLGALFFIVLARNLGPAEFGILMVLITTAVLIADILDVGINTTLVRFVSHSLAANGKALYQYISLGFFCKTIIWLVVLVFGIILSRPISQLLQNSQVLRDLLVYSFVGAGGIALLSISLAIIQAYQRFYVYNFIQILTNLMRILILLLIIQVGLLSIKSVMTLYLLIPLVGLLISLYFLPMQKILRSKYSIGNFSKMFKFSKWVALFTVIGVISSKMDTFLNARLVNNYDLGLYAVANQLIMVAPQVVSSIGAVIAPKFSSFNKKSDMITYFKKVQIFVLGLALTGFLVIPIASYLIPILLGGVYLQSVPIFIILLSATMISLIALPTHVSIIYYFSRPDIFSRLSLGNFIIMFGVGYLMISRYGITGAALTVVISSLFNFLVPLFWLLTKLRR